MASTQVERGRPPSAWPCAAGAFAAYVAVVPLAALLGLFQHPGSLAAWAANVLVSAACLADSLLLCAFACACAWRLARETAMDPFRRRLRRSRAGRVAISFLDGRPVA